MNVQGKNLYPLSHYIGSLTGYYMDAEGEVWSTKRGGLVKLMGSTPMKLRFGRYVEGSTRYFTLNGLSYTHEQLKNGCVYDPRFNEETNNPYERQPGGYGPKVLSAKTLGVDLAKVAEAQKVAAVSSEIRAHAKDMNSGVKDKGFIIATLDPKDGGRLIFGTKPVVHLTPESAKNEMERLANEVPGVKFVMMRIVNTIVSGGVTWE